MAETVPTDGDARREGRALLLSGNRKCEPRMTTREEVKGVRSVERNDEGAEGSGDVGD